MEIYRINPTDKKTTVLAKKAAIICVFAIDNPLHVAFEDCNLHPWADMKSEFRWNEECREANGEKMYEYIKDFLVDFTSLTAQEQSKCYKDFCKKNDYLWDKVWGKIKKLSKEKYPSFKHFLGNDGNIYITTMNGETAFFF